MKLRSRILACASGLLLLSACGVDLGSDVTVGGDKGVSVDSIAPSDDNLFSVGGDTVSTRALAVGDEPYAVKVGATILSQGGSAADAATAMYFALAVTYPVAAGLGGGGICIVRDARTNRAEEFDFLARDSGGGGAYAVPGNVRGFALMQSVYGALPWQRDVAPGEGYAAAGFPISYALAARIATSVDVIRLDAALASEFLDESGKVKLAGTVVSNPDLAATLAMVRTGGPDAFYGGNLGARILAYSAAQGGAIAAGEFARYPVGRTAPQAIQLGNQTVLLPSARTGAGAFAGALFDTLERAEQTNTGANDPQAATVVAVKQALVRFGVKDLPQDLGATGFAALDGNGQAVACGVTMNGPFGSGHNAQGTGVTLARAPSSGAAGLAAAFVTPVIATDSSGTLTLVGAGAGGPNGTAALGYALARLSRGETMLRRSDLRSTGVAPFDTINVIVCQGDACVALPDPGASGLGASADTAK
ncbi:MAG TPA: gamma-glutamyltransferase [Rhizomicrobium sp.]|nr:gamma-glutamyltransferase [Rhizomicrobium sp.]